METEGRRVRRPGEPTGTGSTIAAVLALAAIGVYAFVRHVTASAATDAAPLIAFDPFGLYYPMLDYGFSVLRTGHLPLWNPYQMAGVPFLATFYSGILYPLNALYLVLPVHTAMLVLTAGHVVLAGLGAALYARAALRVSHAAAVAAGVVFMMNSWTLWAFDAQNQLYSIPWIPMLFLAVDRIFATGDAIWGVALGASIAMPILGGNLQTLSYESYAILPYALACAHQRWRAPAPRALVRVGLVLLLGAALGIALSAPQLFPTMALSSTSARSVHGLTQAEIEPLGPQPLPGLRSFLDGARQPLALLFPGVVVFLLAPFSVLSRPYRGCVLALAAAAIAAGLVAHGSSTAVGLAYMHLPMGNWFRELSRAWPVTMFCLAALVAVGIDALVRVPPLRAGIALPAALVALAAGLASVAPPLARWWIAGATLILLAVGARPASRAWRCAAAAGLVVMLVADFDSAVPVNTTLLPYTGGGYQALDALRDAIQRGRAARPAARGMHEWQVYNVSMTPKLGTLYRVPTFDDDEPFTPPRYRDWGMRMTGATMVGPLYLGGWDLQSSTFDPRFLDYAGVGSIVLTRYGPRRTPPVVAGLGAPIPVAVRPSVAVGSRERLMLSRGTAYVFDNPHAWPRAFIADKVQTVATPADVLTALSGLPRDTAPLAIVEAEPGLDPPDTSAGHGSATLVTTEAERVVVRTETDGPGVLVLLDTDLPGWIADVDGVETRILHTNYLFRGVRVPEGTHTVAFRYAPAPVRLGLATGLAGILLASGVTVSAARRVRDRARGPSGASPGAPPGSS